jgi:hypothetical protein
MMFIRSLAQEKTTLSDAMIGETNATTVQTSTTTTIRDGPLTPSNTVFVGRPGTVEREMAGRLFSVHAISESTNTTNPSAKTAVTPSKIPRLKILLGSSVSIKAKTIEADENIDNGYLHNCNGR